MASDLHEPSGHRNVSDLSSPERRSFVKGVVSLGAGLAASPFLSNPAQTQSPAASTPARFAAGASPSADVGRIVPSSGIGSYFQVLYPPSQAPGELRIVCQLHALGPATASRPSAASSSTSTAPGMTAAN